MTDTVKKRYIQVVMLGLPRDPRLAEAAIFFYHAEVPMDVARGYLETLARKMK